MLFCKHFPAYMQRLFLLLSLSEWKNASWNPTQLILEFLFTLNGCMYPCYCILSWLIIIVDVLLAVKNSPQRATWESTIRKSITTSQFKRASRMMRYTITQRRSSHLGYWGVYTTVPYSLAMEKRSYTFTSKYLLWTALPSRIIVAYIVVDRLFTLPGKH